MTVSELNILAIIAMVLTCFIGIAIDPPELHFHRLGRLQTVGASLADALRRKNGYVNEPDYSIRHVTRGADGMNQYYHFTISKTGLGYRAYIDSVPRLSVALEQMNVSHERGRYYISAGKRSTAADAENAAIKWADEQSAIAHIDRE